ncbi:MAG: single-stranded-DNA-specific exonuclease RecJ [Alphaproteobacteria bacterium]|jgi:single-stranded-DNA-specific exonuclease|nr:single-stranded-DNA-specific exonuclease RecJ [Alphaproteobacteria bacterium]
MPAVLGVERSITGKRWLHRGAQGEEAERVALAMAQRHGVPDIVARVMAARGVALDGVERFLNPTLRAELPDPSSLKGMAEAVERLVRAIRGGETIGLFADYDVDGATSAALLSRFIAAAGGKSILHVPDRILEGYGPNAEALASLKQRGAGVVVTLDCGIVAFDVLEQTAESGLDVVVVDHHMAEPSLPRAIAVVNPNRVDESGALGHLAAVGVTFLVVIALNRALREAGWFKDRREPDLMTWLDLVALGTVCDVVALEGLNRALVAQGLKVMARRGNPGLRALASVAKIEQRPEAYHLGFVFGPRVNAAGRVGDADLGARLLSTEDDAEAARIAQALDEHNDSRKEIEAQVQLEAVAQAEQADPNTPVLVVAGDGWHPGVIGIVAGRLRERFNRPACVVALDGETGKGSGRSVKGLALGPAVIAAHQSGLLVGGGGHAMAAGFTIARDRLDTFREFLAERFAAELAGEPLVATVSLDGVLAPAGAKRKVYDALAKLGPFGSGNPEPHFAISSAKIARADVVGQNHVRCILTGADGGKLKGIAFRAMDSDLGPALLNHGGRALHIAGQLRADDWQGREDVQLFIEDAALAE